MKWTKGRGWRRRFSTSRARTTTSCWAGARHPGSSASEREVDGGRQAAGRFTIAQFGFKRSTQRSLASMEKAQARNKLFVKYEGIVPVEKLGGQKCHKLVRSPFTPHEEDDLNELTLYFDTEHYLQVGSVLKDKKGDLLGEYFFHNVRINPEFTEKQFTRETL